jgi:hypothetical protein
LNGLPGVIGIDPPYQAAVLKVRNGKIDGQRLSTPANENSGS